MKAAFVVGFYSPVSDELRTRFAKELDAETLEVFPRSSSHHAFDVNAFKARILQRSEPSVLIVAPDFSRSSEFGWLSSSLAGIREAARSRIGGRSVDLVFCEDTQNPNPVVLALRQFGFGFSSGPEDAVSEQALTIFRGQKRILCVRGKDQTAFEEVLRRAKFEFQDFGTHFAEVPLPYGSNVGNTVKKFSKQHPCLIYAWGVLKYLAPPIKAKFEHFFTGDTPTAAVGWFKQGVLKSGAEKQQNEEPKETKKE